MTAGEWISPYLKPEEIDQLEKLVVEIEKSTDGEVVPILVRQSVLGSIPFLAQFSLLRPLFFSSDFLKASADLRAELEFYRARVYNTKKKTGILLFLSFYERRAVVLADQGIARRLPPETWTEVVRMLTQSVKTGHLAEGMTEAIKKCGQILAEHFPGSAGQTDELGNRLQIKD